jgi:hypothetical protein
VAVAVLADPPVAAAGVVQQLVEVEVLLFDVDQFAAVAVTLHAYNGKPRSALGWRD